MSLTRLFLDAVSTQYYSTLIYDDRFTSKEFINSLYKQPNWKRIDNRVCYDKIFNEVERNNNTLICTSSDIGDKDIIDYSYYLGVIDDVHYLYYRSNDTMSVPDALTLFGFDTSAFIISDDIRIISYNTIPSVYVLLLKKDIKALRDYLFNVDKDVDPF